MNGRAPRAGRATARSCSISASRVLRCRRPPRSRGTPARRSAWLQQAERVTERAPLATSMSTPSPTRSAPAPSAIPLRSSSSANSSAVCPAVPSSSMRAMIVPIALTPARLARQRHGHGQAHRDDVLARDVVAEQLEPVGQPCRARPAGSAHGAGAPTGGRGTPGSLASGSRRRRRGRRRLASASVDAGSCGLLRARLAGRRRRPAPRGRATAAATCWTSAAVTVAEPVEERVDAPGVTLEQSPGGRSGRPAPPGWRARRATSARSGPARTPSRRRSGPPRRTARSSSQVCASTSSALAPSATSMPMKPSDTPSTNPIAWACTPLAICSRRTSRW